MFITRLQLSNIRSYVDAQVRFAEGITLLSGDIGAGKSTILLAIEFALFGIQRGELSGDALLRHGEERGSVTLDFQVGNHQVSVARSIKRTSSGVRQESGSLVIDGVSEQLTAHELKGRVLELFGYPPEHVTKAKGMLFRYTVYTPQEEMKRILLESESSRMDTLRTIFDIDKYKQIEANHAIVLRDLRDQQRFLDGRITELSSRKQEQEELADKLSSTQTELAAAKEALAQAQSVYDELQVSAKRWDDLRANYIASTKAVAEAKSALLARDQRVAHINELLSAELTSPAVVPNPSEAAQRVAELQTKYSSAQSAAKASIDSLSSRIKELIGQGESVAALTKCPTCQQEVSDEHKSHIHEHFKEQAAPLQRQLQEAQKQFGEASAALKRIEAKAAEVANRKAAYDEFIRLQASYDQQLKLRDDLESERKQLLSQEFVIPQTVDFDQEGYQEHQSELAQANQALSAAQQQVASLSSSNAVLSDQMRSLEKKLAQLASYESQFSSNAKMMQWLQEVFSPLVSEIERNVLSRVHAEFSFEFTKYFSSLLEDDALFASVSETFTPVITQDGYDVAYQYLSGGEKTAVALAYRLALNSVINKMIRSIATTDLLILDEPTDGFSSQQLDRVRDVLVDLGLRQILMVSHEQKMTSFVDSVIHVAKHEHFSVIETKSI